MLTLSRTASGALLRRNGEALLLDDDWDDLFRIEGLVDHLRVCSGTRPSIEERNLKPIVRQEVWAAGITYFTSRDARMEESEAAGTSDVYQRCYDAERPELFFKATEHRVVGDGGEVRIRSDALWNVPEPELTLMITQHGEVAGYTIGNDMSSRDIEGENPLYLPQAKTYDACAALGPHIVISDRPPPPECAIEISIDRGSAGTVFHGTTTVARIRRTFDELVEYLRRDNSFPFGCFLMTGTGIVPPPDFTLAPGDQIAVSIDGVGTLRNSVVQTTA